MKHTLIFFLIFFSLPCWGEKQIIQERITFFKKSEKSLANIKKLLKSKDFNEIFHEAKFINEWSKKIPSFFPFGTQASMENNSDASMDIWLNFDKFSEKAKSTEHFSNKIIQAAIKEDLNELIFALKQTSMSCTSCHRSFRN